MAKYSRYDSRNKKRDRHKNQYLERGSMGRRNREIHEANTRRESIYHENVDIPSLYR
jgi:hypothetical protein